MKVAQVVCTFPPYKGGIGNSAAHFARLNREAGFEVEVFTPNYRPIENEVVRPYKVNRLNTWFKFGNAAWLPQLFWQLRDFEVVHFHFPFYGATKAVMNWKLFKGRKAKLIIHFHMDTVGGGIKGLIFQLERIFVQPILMRLADKITCASKDYLENSSLANYYKSHPEKFRIIPFGVELDKFRMMEQIDQSISTILFVGGLDQAHYFKGLNVLLEAMPLIKVGADKPVRLKIVGSGDLRSSYERQVKSLHMENEVEFLGGINDQMLINEYENCSVFVLPSIDRSEAFGIVLIEAMACGKPVVASDLPGVRCVFENGIQGLVAKPGNPADLAEKLSTILDNPGLSGKMSAAARRLVEEKYDWKVIGRQLSELYTK